MKSNFREACLVLMSTTLLLVSACKADPSPPKKGPLATRMEGGSRYIRQEPGNKGVIVFVHGVMGGNPSTWTSSKNKVYWPELLIKDSRKTFEGFDVYAFDYKAPLAGNALSITELAAQMKSRFRDDGVIDTHDQVVFLCHSMGGIVAREYLQENPKAAQKVRFAYFFSTPTQGAEVANIVKIFSQNPDYGDLVPIKRDNFLSNQLLRWTAAGFKMPSYCAYETERTAGIQIVTMASATVLCPDGIEPIEADHISIVKPEDESNTSYITFRNAFNDTGTVLTIPVAGKTLGDVIDLIVSSDDSGGGGYDSRLSGCANTILDLPLRGDPVSAPTQANLIEKLPGSLVDPDIKLKLSVSKRGGFYEIKCSQ